MKQTDAQTFSAHFTHPLYHDEVDEHAPFGNDEGADLFSDFVAGHESTLGADSTLRDILKDDYDLVVSRMSSSRVRPELDSIVIAAGFTLLRLTGQIDAQGKEVLISSLERQSRVYGAAAPQYQQMLSDLQTFSIA